MTCSRSHRTFLAELGLELASLAPALRWLFHTALQGSLPEPRQSPLSLQEKSSQPSRHTPGNGGLGADSWARGQGESLLHCPPLVSLQVCLLEGGQSPARFPLFIQDECSSVWNLFFPKKDFPPCNPSGCSSVGPDQCSQRLPEPLCLG